MRGSGLREARVREPPAVQGRLRPLLRAEGGAHGRAVRDVRARFEGRGGGLGGKDSVALLHSLWKLRGKLGVELVAITIDLGIAGHSDRYVPLARRVCERLGVPCRVVDLRREYGFSVDELRGLRRPVCSLCGAVKWYAARARTWRRWGSST